MIGKLFADGMGHGAIRVLRIHIPRLRQKQFLCLHLKTSCLTYMRCHDFNTLGLCNRHKCLGFLFCLFLIIGLQWDFLALTIQLITVIIRTSRFFCLMEPNSSFIDTAFFLTFDIAPAFK